MNKIGSTLLIEENVPMAPYTTLGVGGPARFLARAQTEDQVLDALAFARAHSCPLFILGGGSNIVVSDAGFPGLVLKIEIPGIQHFGSGERSSIAAGAGGEWDAFVQHCVKLNLAGIECLSGIPGSVGGTPVQNVGAYGEEVGEVIFAVRALDVDSHSITELGNSECRFAYRSSIFNTSHKNRYVILRVDFVLRSDGEPRIGNRDLQCRFAGKVPTIGQVREAVLEIRRAKGMVLLDGDPDSKSVGSFFRNPILSPAAASGVEEQARTRGLLSSSETIPRFAAPEGKEKLPAAWLIERAGFPKGHTRGRAALSGKHNLALTNRGGASAQEILDLMRLIQVRVRNMFGVDLQPEPVFVGFDQEIY